MCQTDNKKYELKFLQKPYTYKIALKKLTYSIFLITIILMQKTNFPSPGGAIARICPSGDANGIYEILKFCRFVPNMIFVKKYILL